MVGTVPYGHRMVESCFTAAAMKSYRFRVETEPTFKPGKPTVLFREPMLTLSGNDVTFWDISPDGKRFLMMKEAATEAPRKINIVMNWLEELKQRVPVK